MEVHPHTHTERKKWTHYFWEFLMLFLAVFCGFLAENQREHIVEHRWELKYMSSLYEDLKRDTADLNEDIPFWETVLQRIDSLRLEIEKPPSARNILSFYRYVAKIRYFDGFEYHDRTIEQLKNAGNFKLIRKTPIADSLIDYDARINSILRDMESQAKAVYQQLNFLQDKIFSSKFYYLRNKSKQLDSAFKKDPEDFAFPERNQPDLFQYYNNLEFYRTLNSYRLVTSKILLRKAVNLINLLRKEYKIKE